MNIHVCICLYLESSWEVGGGQKIIQPEKKQNHVTLVMSHKLTNYKQPKWWWELVWEAETSPTHHSSASEK